MLCINKPHKTKFKKDFQIIILLQHSEVKSNGNQIGLILKMMIPYLTAILNYLY